MSSQKKRRSKSERLTKNTQDFNDCGGDVDEYKKEKEAQAKTILHNIVDYEENKEEKEDAIVKTCKKNQKICNRMLREINAILEEDSSDEEAKENKIRSNECLNADNLYFGQQIGAAERACDEDLFKQDLVNTVNEVDENILQLLLNICGQWMSVQPRILNTIIKIMTYLEKNRQTSEETIPHYSNKICYPLDDKFESVKGVKQCFVADDNYSLDAVILDTITNAKFQYADEDAMNNRIKSNIQSIFSQLMTATQCVISNMKMHISEMDLYKYEVQIKSTNNNNSNNNDNIESNVSPTIARINFIKTQIEDFLYDDIWMITELFSVEGKIKLDDLAMHAISVALHKYFDLDIKGLVISYEQHNDL